MRITGPGIARTAEAKTAKRSGAAGERFVVGSRGAAIASAPDIAGQPLGGVDALLALQGVDDPVLARKRKVRRSAQLLDALDEIKADLLTGHIGEGKLNRLVALVSQLRDSVEPGLDGIADEIDLRARVELAKLGR
ncbi:MAG: flagellar assembly regulator FliX [Alphaproteobacteria bacterium]|nr:flagellar assembly regulator FliX [Alphaproteobacteria bacterium]